ncbi:MAG: sulfite exporter TauE/SafE family protein [Desulfatirhabdiaceae bacterium]
MNHNMKFFIIFAVLSFLVASPLLISDTAYADKLTDAIAKTPAGTDKGQIDTKGEPGYLGIPGGPKVNLVVAFLWAIWVGWIFSTVGAFGGIMAGVGHITIFKLGAYASSFKESSPMLNKVVTDSIRVSNQFLVGMSALITSIKYYQMGRLVLPLGVALAIGSIAGSYLVPLLTAGKVSFKAYQGYFGLFVLVLGCWMLYETTPKGQASKKKAKQAADAFEKTMKEQRAGANVDIKSLGVKVTSFTASKFSFTFYGVEFSFNPLYPVLGGFVIACVASFIGVGGGFLLVPFLTSISGLPMFLAAGTSALAVLIGMITSIFSYLQQGVIVHWSLIGLEMVGIVVGSLVGPMTQKYISDKWLKRLFIILAFVTGLDYAMKGFFGIKLIPG